MAVLGLVLGSIGTATASGITKAAVKRIATKIVDKRAPGLAVSHASTADTLDGTTVNQLKTTQYQFALPTQPAAGSREYTFPTLPPGTYFATYSFPVAVSTGSTIVACFFKSSPAASTYVGLGYSSNSGLGYATLGNSAPVTTTSTFVMDCNSAGGTFATNAGGASANVTFTPIDIPVVATATGAKGTATSSGAGQP